MLTQQSQVHKCLLKSKTEVYIQAELIREADQEYERAEHPIEEPDQEYRGHFK